MDPILELSQISKEILFSLPPEPARGLSAMELAETLLHDRSPAGRARIAAGLAELGGVVGLHVGVGDDGLGQAGVPLYSLPGESVNRVRRAAALLDWAARRPDLPLG